MVTFTSIVLKLLLGIGLGIAENVHQSILIPLRTGFRPEAIERGVKDGSFYVNEVHTAAIWQGDVETGKVIQLVPGLETSNLTGIIGLGMAYSREGDVLFVAGGVTGTVTAYDGTTGDVLGVWAPFGMDSLVNDCAVDPSAGVYCTNSFASSLVFIPYMGNGPLPDPDSFQIITLGGEWKGGEGLVNANGIEVNPLGHLLVADFAQGMIYLLKNPLSGEAVELLMTDDTGLGLDRLVNADGLEISEDGDTLFVVSNFIETVYVLEFSDTTESSSSAYEHATIVSAITSDLFRIPTTGTLVGDGIFLVANSRFDVCPPPGLAAIPEEECNVSYPFEVVGFYV